MRNESIEETKTVTLIVQSVSWCIMIFRNLNHIAFLNISKADYFCLISTIGESEAINLLENANLTKESGTI